MKKRKFKINFQITKRWKYTLILVGMLIIATGIYALSIGVKPNPGHFLSEVSSSGCTGNQVVMWNGVNFVCKDEPQKGMEIYAMNKTCGAGDSLTTSATCTTPYGTHNNRFIGYILE